MGGVRRSGRIAKEIGILLLGTDTSGRVFSEQTKTVVLSRHGAGILSQHRLAPDDILTIRFLGGSAEVAVRLVGEMGKDARGYTYGVAFVDPDVDFWELKFPPPPQWIGNQTSELKCSVCQTRGMVDQTEVEADVYALAGYILRLCPTCGTSTEWRQANAAALTSPTPTKLTELAVPAAKPTAIEERPIVREEFVEAEEPIISSPASSYSGEVADLILLQANRTTPVEVAPAKPEISEALPAAATSVVARTANRRRDVRTRVSFTACVRYGDSPEEIVECDNISKGGLSFRSRRPYSIGSLIQVAVPYSPGSHPIFVEARIRHAEPLSGSAIVRYGAGYTAKRSGNPVR
jgi:PilZ domain